MTQSKRRRWVDWAEHAREMGLVAKAAKGSMTHAVIFRRLGERSMRADALCGHAEGLDPIDLRRGVPECRKCAKKMGITDAVSALASLDEREGSREAEDADRGGVRGGHEALPVEGSGEDG